MTRRTWLGWLASLTLLAGLAQPAWAQDEGSSGTRPPVLQYTIWAACAVLVLITVCKPSRKG